MTYPEHEKLKAVANRSQIIGEFLDSLPEGLFLAQWEGDEGWEKGVPARLSIEVVLAKYFGIDLAIIETEKRQMIEEIRNAGK